MARKRSTNKHSDDNADEEPAERHISALLQIRAVRSSIKAEPTYTHISVHMRRLDDTREEKNVQKMGKKKKKKKIF